MAEWIEDLVRERAEAARTTLEDPLDPSRRFPFEVGKVRGRSHGPKPDTPKVAGSAAFATGSRRSSAR